MKYNINLYISLSRSLSVWILVIFLLIYFLLLVFSSKVKQKTKKQRESKEIINKANETDNISNMIRF